MSSLYVLIGVLHLFRLSRRLFTTMWILELNRTEQTKPILINFSTFCQLNTDRTKKKQKSVDLRQSNEWLTAIHFLFVVVIKQLSLSSNNSFSLQFIIPSINHTDQHLAYVTFYKSDTQYTYNTNITHKTHKKSHQTPHNTQRQHREVHA